VDIASLFVGRNVLAPSLSSSASSNVTVRWLGTAGFAISCGDHVVLIDPYVTRASLSSCVIGAVVPDAVRIATELPRADAIVLGHTHFDHALDAPLIAKRTGAQVFGSRSAATLCRASGVEERQVHVVEREAGEAPITKEVGPFTLRFLPAAHSKFMLGRVPFPGDIADCDDVPMRTERYRCGAVFTVEIEVAGKRIVHLGSAEVVGDKHRDADLLLLCVAGWTTSVNLPERAVRAFSPRAVLLSHWDDFFASMDAPAKPLPAMKIERLVDRLHRARDVMTFALPIRGEVVL
jgi:L-ascorbate metabolism protein UlaG (beta-lactamase superfamily)